MGWVWNDPFWLRIQYFHSGFSMSSAATLHSTILLSHSRGFCFPTWWIQLSCTSASPLWFLVLTQPESTFCLCMSRFMQGLCGTALPACPLLHRHHPNVLRQMTHSYTASFPHTRHLPSSQHSWAQPWIFSKFCWSANIPASKCVCWKTCEIPAWEDVDKATQKSLVFTDSTWASSLEASLPPSLLGLFSPKGVRITCGRCGLQAEQRGLCPEGLGRCPSGEPGSPTVAEGSRASPPSLRMEFAPKILFVSPQLLSTMEEGAVPTLKCQLPVLGIISIFLQFYCDHYSNYYLLL